MKKLLFLLSLFAPIAYSSPDSEMAARQAFTNAVDAFVATLAPHANVREAENNLNLCKKVAHLASVTPEQEYEAYMICLEKTKQEALQNIVNAYDALSEAASAHGEFLKARIEEKRGQEELKKQNPQKNGGADEPGSPATK